MLVLAKSEAKRNTTTTTTTPATKELEVVEGDDGSDIHAVASGKIKVWRARVSFKGQVQWFIKA